MIDYSECLIKINKGLRDYREAVLRNQMFEAFKIAEDLKELCQWLEAWSYQKAQSGNEI
jgi:transposase